MKSYCLIAFLFISTVAFSQSGKLDSLLEVLKTQSNNTNKVNTLNSISNIYYSNGDQINTIEFGKRALALAEKLNYTHGRLEAHCSLHQGYSQFGDTPEKLRNIYRCLKLAEESGEKVYVGLSLQFIGSTYSVMGNYDDALKYFFASLKVRKEMNDSAAIGQTFNSIGELYFKTGNYANALSYFTRALKIYQELGDRGPYWGISWSYTNIAYVQVESGLLANKTGKKTESMNDFSDALKNSFLALEIKAKHGFNPGIIESYLQIGEINMYIKKYSIAKNYFEKGLQLSISTGSLMNLPELYLFLSRTDSSRGDYLHAFQDYKMFAIYRDSLESKKREDEALKMQMQYEFDKKDIAAKAEQGKKDAMTGAEINRQKLARNFSIGGAFSILFFGGFAFHNFRKRKRLENENTLADERLRISRDLHDDMGASLSSISVFSSAVKQKLLNNETQEAEQLLERMSTDAQEMVSGMSEMVWTISPHNDTIEKLTERLQVYAAGMLSAKNISFKLECDDELKDKKLSVDFRKNIFLILKEAVNNAAKYSGAGEVKLIVSKRGSRFVAVLSDNGKGFDISSGKTGNGLRNMQQRADEIQSQLMISSEINKGTSVIVECLML